MRRMYWISLHTLIDSRLRVWDVSADHQPHREGSGSRSQHLHQSGQWAEEGKDLPQGRGSLPSTCPQATQLSMEILPSSTILSFVTYAQIIQTKVPSGERQRKQWPGCKKNKSCLNMVRNKNVLLDPNSEVLWGGGEPPNPPIFLFRLPGFCIL